MAGVVYLPASFSPTQAHKPPAAEHRNDPRLHKLRRFFQKADCPAGNYAATFLQVADSNDLDWRLLPSISYLESTGGKSSRNHNMFGWDSGRTRFDSPIAGIHSVGYRLAHSQLYRDKSLDELLATYNPIGDYAQKVKSVMRRIAPTE